MLIDIYTINDEKKVIISSVRDKLPSEPFEYIGSVEHDDDIDPLSYSVNHVIWHHVRNTLYSIGIINPSEYEIFWIDEEPTIPSFEIGPLDIIDNRTNISEITKTYTMASPNCIIGVAFRNPAGGSGIFPITVTHGDEPLTEVQRGIHAGAGISIVFFVGTGLTIEEADLVISFPSGNIGPVCARITDDLPATISVAGSSKYTANSTIFAPSVLSISSGGIIKHGWAGISGNVLPTVIPEEKIEIVANTHIIGGTEVAFSSYDIVSGDWNQTDDVYSYDDENITGQLRLQLGQNINGQNGVEIEATIEDGGFIRLMLETTIGNLSLTHSQTLNGKIFISGNITGTCNSVLLEVKGNVSVKNFKLYRNSKTLLAAFGSIKAPYLDVAGCSYKLASSTFGSVVAVGLNDH